MRLRPVMMTASVTILGLFPMLMSSGVGVETQRPLASVVVGGLITATFLTLLLLPRSTSGSKPGAVRPSPDAGRACDPCQVPLQASRRHCASTGSRRSMTTCSIHDA